MSNDYVGPVRPAHALHQWYFISSIFNINCSTFNSQNRRHQTNLSPNRPLSSPHRQRPRLDPKLHAHQPNPTPTLCHSSGHPQHCVPPNRSNHNCRRRIARRAACSARAPEALAALLVLDPGWVCRAGRERRGGGTARGVGGGRRDAGSSRLAFVAALALSGELDDWRRGAGRARWRGHCAQA